MAGIQWYDGLSVGIKMIDNQHKMMISKLNDMYIAVEENKGINLVMKTFHFLTEYTEFHFLTEEKHMKEQDYPGTDYHVEQHNEFKTTLNNLLDDFKEEGATANLAESINRLLVNWFIKHITSIDIEFGRYLQGKGLADIKE
jgi:hemerythrin